jgi:CyaY protein
MTDLEFQDRADALLKAVEAACDRINDETDADIDNQRSGGMVTLSFANRSQIIINLQKPLHEVWLAAREGGYHYQWDPQAGAGVGGGGASTQPGAHGAWVASKTGSEFFADLNRCASQQSGMKLTF